MIENLQIYVFKQKLDGLIDIKLKEYEHLTKDGKFDKLKEDIKDYLDSYKLNLIDEDE
jgi:hypothetical protein